MVDSRLACLDSPILENSGIIFIEQFVQDVVDFSSQYGSDISISYTAYNISGKPSKFPDYGDFPQAFVMRTYGKWWSEAPSKREVFMAQNFGSIISQDYIDLKFEQAVYPYGVSIYETYNPGSVVRIWAGLENNRWKLLWEGESQIVGHTPRIFSPQIRTINEPTCLIRLEFDHSKLEYYTELDAVLLIGTNKLIVYDTASLNNGPRLICNSNVSKGCNDTACISSINCNTLKISSTTSPSNLAVGNSSSGNIKAGVISSSAISITPPISDLTNRIIKLNIHAIPFQADTSSSVSSLLEVRDSLLQDLDDSTLKCSNQFERANSGPFACLPDETMIYIFRFLDLVSLCQCAKINKHFNSIAMDSLLYTELNLKPYWPWISCDNLENLSSRCKHLVKLDLSWCGNYSKIRMDSFTKFIKDCGHQLMVLRLDSCKFIDDDCIKQITLTCLNLRELTLRNCSKIKTEGFESLASLDNLERLDLYRTAIESAPLVKILTASPHLKHINLGSCVRVSSMDEVAHALGTYNRELRTVDFWKTYSLTPVGVRALSQCSQLEEVDFGWCLGVSIPGDCMTALAKGCPKLKKLFMAALRGIMDRDLHPFVTHCPHLQQLDLLGVRSITADICLRFLNSCKDLRLLDLSFCDLIQESEVLVWRKQFPQVSIKRSFQYEGASVGCNFPNHY
ncbi:F box and leucine-rich-repeat gene 4 [Lycorma delicatula]|uniref:F box and leucine-rich-repeat gene 4 n=1 Tax=Lycorma delicatula TaxID=130591 RepID=UPI003F5193D5